MSRYELLKAFNRQKRAVYLPYVMLGFPSVIETVNICKALIEEGVNGFELGFPFRDPVADGPILQEVANIALNNGFKLEQGAELVRQIRSMDSTIPLTGMAYYNTVAARGASKFYKEFSKAGLDGLLVPDLPPEYAEEIAPYAKEYGLDLIFIASPNTSADRLDLISRKAAGFIYIVTKLGITGVNDEYDSGLKELFKNVHSCINLPAVAGFGISEPAQAQRVIQAGADGVITGSRLSEIISMDYKNRTGNYPAVREHTRAMLGALERK